jgi:hypothetical protein
VIRVWRVHLRDRRRLHHRLLSAFTPASSGVRAQKSDGPATTGAAPAVPVRRGTRPHPTSTAPASLPVERYRAASLLQLQNWVAQNIFEHTQDMHRWGHVISEQVDDNNNNKVLKQSDKAIICLTVVAMAE